MILSLIMLPLIGAGIGWLTNVVAIKMIFRPRDPFRLPFIPISIQGLLPRRKRELAASVGATVEKELLSVDDLLVELDRPEFREGMINAMESYVDRRMEDIMPRFLPVGLRTSVMALITEFLRKESALLLEDIASAVRSEVRSRVNFAELVERRINELDLGELEKIVIGIAHRELKAIEILGGVLGFLIGLGQAGFLYLALSRP